MGLWGQQSGSQSPAMTGLQQDAVYEDVGVGQDLREGAARRRLLLVPLQDLRAQQFKEGPRRAGASSMLFFRLWVHRSGAHAACCLLQLEADPCARHTPIAPAKAYIHSCMFHKLFCSRLVGW